MLVICFLTLSAATTIPYSVGELYPYINIIVLLGIISVVLVSWRDENTQESLPIYLLVIVLLSVAYRLLIFLFPASMLGIDPDAYAIQMTRVKAAGDFSAITFGFYNQAPVHILEGVIAGFVTGLPASTANGVFSIIGGIAGPLLAGGFARRLRPSSPRTTIVAAGVGAVLGYSVKFSYLPIAQTTGVLYSLFAIFAIFIFATGYDRRWLPIGLLMVVGAVYSHKLVVVATALAIGGSWLLTTIHPSSRNTATVKRLSWSTLGILGIIVFVQLFYVTAYGESVFFRILLRSPPGPTPQIPTEAIDSYTLLIRAFRLSYVVLLGLISGLIWIIWVWRTLRTKTPRQDILFLGLVSPLTGLVILLYPLDVNPVRSIYFSELILASLVAVGLYWHAVDSQQSSGKLYRIVGMAGVLLLIVTAGVSPIAGPDFNSLSRSYLNTEEVEAKEWGYDKVDGQIVTDQYYASENPPSIINDAHAIKNADLDKFKYVPGIYHSREFTTVRPDTVAHRNCIKTFRTDAGPLQLQYNPSNVLDTTYNRVFDSGCVAFYSRSNVETSTT